ncbi:ATP-binding protein [Variovorax ginsengisoli]|uniref:histidine kinase n=1 Tax=Variovorax ginsengisoli TaxID=363844 RepID=A0ABT9S3L1_9BURK|nr:ATP-binding protein [Variovorax ginsengisoli]MDP9898920.1 two-component system sensor histidine kinase BaeS [Variovorax ginsengisoli]
MRVRFPRLPTSRLTLSKKVFLAMATLLALLLLIFASFSILGLQRGLGPYVAEIEIRRMDWLAEILQKKYAVHGNWDTVRAERSVLPRPTRNDGGDAPEFERHRGMPPGGPPPDEGNTPPPEGANAPPDGSMQPRFIPPPFIRGRDAIYQRLEVIDAADKHVAGASVDVNEAARLPLLHDGRVIGTLLLAPLQELESEADRAFVARQSNVIALTGGVGLIIALILSWLLARHWFTPIDELTQGAKSIARGRLDTRVTPRGSDELALLGHTFNSMAERLDTIEASRRAWLADVAHELRTPLAAMRAEIEALQDGIRTFDDKTALRLHRQVMRLGQLVDDLRSSMHEPEGIAASLVPVFPLALLHETLALARERFAQRAITLDTQGLDELTARQPMVMGDPRRLHQVFMNLLENTLAYTDAGGQLQLGARVQGAPDAMCLVLRFDDSAPGPAAHELQRLFDRLYRGDASRSRQVRDADMNVGGSGLGLSICRTLIEQHGGTIEASASPLGGLGITLTLPLIADN